MLSIVIPTSNAEDTIGELLESIKAQDFHDDYEIIIIDNGSKDKTEEIIKKYMNLLSIKYYKYKESLGVANSKNAAIDKASGEFILFLDHDVTLPPRTLFLLSTILNKENYNTVFQLKLVYPSGLIDSCGGLIDELGYPRELRKGEPAENQCMDVTDILYAKGSAMLISKKLLDELKGFDPNYFYEYDDTDICFRAIKRGYKVKLLPTYIIHHEHGALPKDLRSREIRLTYFLESRRLYFLLKNFSRRYLLRKMPKVLFYFFGSMLMDLVKRRKTYLFKARVKALLWVISKLPEIYRKRKNEIFINEEELIKKGLIVKH
ncbi:glycosyltransferase family 2 protein [Sulfuracidifex metallicus]|uniref:Glycosyltransferase n=1 Tax=Sulfuracidifex metallicus DSM 6482 = JCM 9184 TaxID=523847 RepID=A0A6A9QII3_SULME|nr:glycosyltransferase family 2 protein [Sulfuracidifex metallicus]MUN28484.1 glycosyltransferase [Sulfuracidifex metallicus DSM 6482 = JCM 9184]WOE50993.1 glycosyltransferase family 2 protein [Sulfuracidifex metallicus DSM 6482 = JCM 9184]